MKNLISSVLLALFIALLLGAAFFVYISPIMLLSRFGFFSISPFSGFSMSDVVRLVCAESISASTPLVGKAIFVLVFQIFLSLLASLFGFLFFSKVMRIFLPNDDYFCSFYKFLIALAFFFPAIFGAISIFFRLPVKIVLLVLGGVIFALTAFFSIMILKILPDSASEKRRDLFKQ